MAVITLEEIKNIMNITNNTYDGQIQYLIPFVQDDIIDYCNNLFRDKDTSYEAFTIEFNDLDPPTITDTQGLFLQYGFLDGMDIAVEGSYRNNGVFTISSASSATLTLNVSEELIDEGTTDYYGGNYIRISRVHWPRALKLIAAKMIWFHISKSKSFDIKSKSLGPSSVTYAENEGGYPKQIMNSLKKYRQVVIY